MENVLIQNNPLQSYHQLTDPILLSCQCYQYIQYRSLHAVPFIFISLFFIHIRNDNLIDGLVRICSTFHIIDEIVAQQSFLSPSKLRVTANSMLH